MGKQAFWSAFVAFIVLLGVVPFYWFSYHPKKIREECLSVSLNAVLDAYKDRKLAAGKVSSYYRSHTDLGTDRSLAAEEARNEGMLLIAQQKEGYQVCLQMHGLQE